MGQILYQVDAFTDRAFAGNPAGVCLLTEPAGERWMQQVAAEMNLAETAFLLPRGGATFGLRWFTPAVEVDLCGHATLASAHVLWETGVLRPDESAAFETRSGRLAAARAGDWIELDFPAAPDSPVSAPPALEAALRVPLRYVGQNAFDYLVEVDSEDVVRTLAPDLRALKALPVRGVCVTSRASSAGFDFVSRFFAPAVGIDEDPVTGSAHCCLGPYWGRKLGRSALVGHQASARGGIVRVRNAGDRVVLGGQAVTVMKIDLMVAPSA
jgi:PhzF family phenazine biosynthesis protein